MTLATNTQLALQHLRKSNFTAYISALAALGVDVTSELGVDSIKVLASKVTPPALSTNNLYLPSLSEEELETLRLNAILFASMWSKGGPNSLVNVSGQGKHKLDTMTRHHIHFGILVIENILNQCSPPVKTINHDIGFIENQCTKIQEAISQYETKKQKKIRIAGKILAFFTSLAFGVLQTGIAMFFVGMLAFSPTGWAMLALLCGALALGGIFSYVSYCTMRHDIPSILQEVIGKDRFLQGFREYKDKNGKTVPFNRKQMTQLGVFTFLFALPSATATGAFAFTSTFSIPTMLALFGIIAPTWIFFPIGLGFAAIIAISMTLFMVRSFHAFIANHNGSVKSFLGKAFNQIGEIIDEKINPQKYPLGNKIAKTLAYIGTGLFCAMGLIGLAISSISSINSVTALAGRLFNASTVISSSIGIVIGGVLSLFARIFFTIAKCSNVVVNVFKFTCQKTSSKIDKFGLLSGLLIDLPLSAISWFDSFVRPPLPHPVVPINLDVKTAFVATACTTAKEAGVVINSMFHAEKGSKKVELDAAQHQEFNNTYSNPKASFVKKPAQLHNYSLFKTNVEEKNTTTIPKHYPSAMTLN